MHYVRRSSRRKTLAQRARRVLVGKMGVTGACPGLYDAWTAALGVDVRAVRFGSNIGFSDGSVLLRGLYQSRKAGKYTDYEWTWRALHG